MKMDENAKGSCYRAQLIYTPTKPVQPMHDR